MEDLPREKDNMENSAEIIIVFLVCRKQDHIAILVHDIR